MSYTLCRPVFVFVSVCITFPPSMPMWHLLWSWRWQRRSGNLSQAGWWPSPCPYAHSEDTLPHTGCFVTSHTGTNTHTQKHIKSKLQLNTHKHSSYTLYVVLHHPCTECEGNERVTEATVCALPNHHIMECSDNIQHAYHMGSTHQCRDGHNTYKNI